MSNYYTGAFLFSCLREAVVPKYGEEREPRWILGAGKGTQSWIYRNYGRSPVLWSSGSVIARRTGQGSPSPLPKPGATSGAVKKAGFAKAGLKISF
jgi:hypothetical protein